MKIIDLHTHSNKSDGTYAPSDLVTLAKNAGLSALALTDHDTADGLDEAKNAGQEQGLEVISGVELVAEYLDNEIHILGYFIEYKGQYFMKSLEKLASIRMERNEKLLKRLNQINICITIEDLMAETSGKTITRLHFARAMVTHGYVKTLSEAFERYLSPGRPAFVGRNAFEYGECIEVIHKSGGVAALAHPYIYKWSGGEVIQMLEVLSNAGLDAVEAIYPLHNPRQKESLLKAAERLGLKITGGSDFHGANKPNIKIGTGIDNIRVDYEVLEKLRK